MPNDEFSQQRLEAARMFAQTMIVVDDEASLEFVEESVPNNVVKPKLGQKVAAAGGDAERNRQDFTHVLYAKSLVDKAMEIGLICSVLQYRPKEDEGQLKTRVLKASTRVDIVCLDWKIHKDKGATACLLIKEIVRKDQKQNGRLRLIAIYTGDRERDKILNEVKDSFDETERLRMKLRISEDGREICSDVGLKIVCLFKKHGLPFMDDREKDRLNESELPNRLLREFSNLSEGVLSNVALGTIAKIRDLTHKVVSSFSGEMDGPYFNHRATIRVPEEAEEYAVNIVLSKLSSAIKIQNIGREIAGRTAVESRVKLIADGHENLEFQYKKKDNTICEKIPIDDVTQMILNGYECRFNSINFRQKPSKDDFERNFTSLFASSPDESDMLTKKFAVLTSIRSHLADYEGAVQTSRPKLGLGAVVIDSNKKYWLCLQASCDSVSLDSNKIHAFLFAPLEKDERQPDHIVPCGSTANQTRFIGLKVPEKGYTQVKYFEFRPDPETKTVLAERNEQDGPFCFKGENDQEFIWIAQLKQRRALRTAGMIGQQMTRFGFDEFEPFRT